MQRYEKENNIKLFDINSNEKVQIAFFKLLIMRSVFDFFLKQLYKKSQNCITFVQIFKFPFYGKT
jgi:hypothetical protein